MTHNTDPADLVSALRILIAASLAPSGPTQSEAAVLIQHLDIPIEWVHKLLGNWKIYYRRYKKPKFRELVKPGLPRFLTIRMLGSMRQVKNGKWCRLCGQKVEAPQKTWHRACWSEFKVFNSVGWFEICQQVFKNCGYKCEQCEVPLSRTRKTRKQFVKHQFDHIIPVALNGASILENCMCLCVKCHKVKSKQDMILIMAARKERKRLLKEAESGE